MSGILSPNGMIYNPTDGKLVGYRNPVTNSDDDLLSAYPFITPSKKAEDKFTRVLLIGDSLTMRNCTYATSKTVSSINGRYVTIAETGPTMVPGQRVRLYNQADDQVSITDAIVTQVVAGTSFTCVFPFDVTGRISGTTSYMSLDRLSDTGPFNYARGIMNLQGRFCQVTNMAIGGDTTTDILNKIVNMNVSEYDIVVELSGINDLDGTDISDAIISRKELIYNYCLDRGVYVHAGTIWPVMAGDSRDTATDIQVIKDVNAWIIQKSNSEPGMLYWDGYTALKDPATEYGVSTYLESAGVHALPAGAMAAGICYVNACGKHYKRNGVFTGTTIRPFYRAPDAMTANLLTNPGFSGTGGSKSGGTWSGNLPDNWSGVQTGGTTTITLAARADGNGNDMTIAKSATGSNSVTVSQDITSQLSAGKIYRFLTDYETITKNTGHYFRCYILVVVGGVSLSYTLDWNALSYANGGRLADIGRKFRFESTPVIIPSNATSVSFVYAIDNGASGDCAVRVGMPEVYQIG